MAFDTLEYSVCQDCLMFIAYGETPEDREESEFTEAVAREVDGKDAHFVCGVTPTEDDPDGNGEDAFSWQECELCRSGLGGSRHGVTLLIKLPEDPDHESEECAQSSGDRPAGDPAQA